MNRNHFFLLGLVVLFVGIQFRFVNAYVLNEKASTFMAERFGSAGDAPVAMSWLGRPFRPAIAQTITPPQWIGWALLAIGAVLVLHALAMPKPGGGD